MAIQKTLYQTFALGAASALTGQLIGKMAFKSFGAAQLPALVNGAVFLGTKFLASHVISTNDRSHKKTYRVFHNVVAFVAAWGLTPMIVQYLFKAKISLKQSLYLSAGPAIIWIANPNVWP